MTVTGAFMFKMPIAHTTNLACRNEHIAENFEAGQPGGALCEVLELVRRVLCRIPRTPPRASDKRCRDWRFRALNPKP